MDDEESYLMERDIARLQLANTVGLLHLEAAREGLSQEKRAALREAIQPLEELVAGQ